MDRRIKRKKWTEYLPHGLHMFLRWCRRLGRKVVFHAAYLCFAVLPIRENKIVFDNYLGKGFGCNPKYVALALIGQGPDRYDLVWPVSRRDRKKSAFPPRIRTVRYGSLRSLYEYATARVWISNYHKVSYVRRGLRKRPGQYFVQTWHGSLGIKKIDGDVDAFTQREDWLKLAKASSEMTDFWISNSDFETNVYKSAFWGVTDEKVLLWGHPRNDIFFDRERMDRAREKVADAYGAAGKKLLLYAPTFRDDHRTDCYEVDYPALLRRLGERFGGEWTVLARMHPHIRGLGEAVIPAGPDVADVTYYPDMQELLAAADCLLTDYSSCAFDYILTRRPVFLYASDIGGYDGERGFYYPLESAPFPLARDNEELLANIGGFDQAAYLEKCEAFLRDKGCVEDGRASERVAALVRRLTEPPAGQG